MRRGTTPTHIFTTDVDLSSATVMFVTYQQYGRTIIEKTLEDGIKVFEDHIEVPITQEDTLAIRHDAQVQIQIRVGFEDGSRLASNIMHTCAFDILKDGEI